MSTTMTLPPLTHDAPDEVLQEYLRRFPNGLSQKLNEAAAEYRNARGEHENRLTTYQLLICPQLIPLIDGEWRRLQNNSNPNLGHGNVQALRAALDAIATFQDFRRITRDEREVLRGGPIDYHRSRGYRGPFTLREILDRYPMLALMNKRADAQAARAAQAREEAEQEAERAKQAAIQAARLPNAVALLRRLAQDGITVGLSGEKSLQAHPPALLTPKDTAELVELKPELIEILTAAPVTV